MSGCEAEPHPPQPPGALGLVDVDEVGHHAALQEAALSLHPDLKHKQKQTIASLHFPLPGTKK